MNRSTLLMTAALLFVVAVLYSPQTAAETTAGRPPSAFLPLYETGVGWAEDEYTTAIAFGDVDGDGRDEMVIARRAITGPRILLIDDAEAGFALLWTFGGGWGVAAWPTAVAFGDVDGDGRDELAVARVSGINERVWVFDDATGNFAAWHEYPGAHPDPQRGRGSASSGPRLPRDSG